MAAGAIPLSKNDKVRVNSGDPVSGYLEDKLTSSDNSVTFEVNSCNCEIDVRATPGGFIETWTKVTLEYSDFPGSNPTSTLTPTEFSAVVAGTTPLHWKLKVNTEFTGGTASAVTLGILLNGTNYDQTDVFTAAGVNRGGVKPISTDDILDQTSTDTIDFYLIVTGDSVNNLTQGSVDVWVNTAVLV